MRTAGPKSGEAEDQIAPQLFAASMAITFELISVALWGKLYRVCAVWDVGGDSVAWLDAKPAEGGSEQSDLLTDLSIRPLSDNLRLSRLDDRQMILVADLEQILSVVQLGTHKPARNFVHRLVILENLQ